MFGIGLPELIVIFAVALIVIDPDKLPGLAKSLAKGMMEMKKTLEQVKTSLAEENDTVVDALTQTQHQITDASQDKMLASDLSHWRPAAGPTTQKNEGQDGADATEGAIDPEALADAEAIESFADGEKIGVDRSPVAEVLESTESTSADSARTEATPDPATQANGAETATTAQHLPVNSPEKTL